MTRFIIIRHGRTAANKGAYFAGQMDVPLLDEGEEQAKRTAQYVLENYRVDCIYSSDLMRTCQTVQPIADSLGLPIYTCKELREVNVGNWQGRLRVDIQRENPEQYAQYVSNIGSFRFDGGEGFADVMERARLALARIAKENDGQNVVIGTHGGVIRSLYAVWNGLPASQIKEAPLVPNCSITIVEYDNDGHTTCLRFASDEHLSNTNADGAKPTTV